MKSADDWAFIAIEALGLHTDDGLASDRPTLINIVRQIQADAANSLPPDVPPGVLLSEERIKEIEGRRQAVKSALWKHDGHCCIQSVRNKPKQEEMIIYDEGGHGENEAEFIAHTPDDITALLAERRTLLRLLHDSDSLDAYRHGWDARVTYGERTTLGELRIGAVFETEHGIRQIKTSEWVSATHILCYHLADGGPAHFHIDSGSRVREITVAGVTPSL